jgi:hypothetical protein
MAYTYLLELYETIHRRSLEARGALEATTGVEHERHRGRVDALEELDQFLRRNYHERLPRRVRLRIDEGA